MVIKVLAENTAVSEAFQPEHGLSLYIETAGRKILFDTGKSDVFLRNACKLGVNIADIDLAVISHGHIDHGGGLAYFLEANTKAPIYLHPKALERHYSDRPAGRAFIGLDNELAKSGRLVFTGERFVISDGIMLFSDVMGQALLSTSNNMLMTEKEGRIVADPFAHEQNLVITEAGKTMLFAGCAHKGIVNIVGRLGELMDKPADYVFGGFHLYSHSAKKSEAPALILQIGGMLKNTHAKYYTCHCTGMEPYALLKSVMGDQLEYLPAGRVIEI